MDAAAGPDRQALLPYVPEDRKQALAAGASLPERSDGVALFADLSGFTALTEALAATHGPERGAEELTRQLTLAYGGLVREAHRRRGSVIGFSGDAITCWFGGDDGRAAIAAAHGMQRAIAALPAVPLAAGSTLALGVKVAAVRGPVRRFLVGDPAIQVVDVLAGRTLDRLAACEALARRGEVVVDASLAEAPRARPLETRADPRTGARGIVLGEAPDAPAEDPWPPLPEGAGDWVRAWVLPAVQERLRSGLDGMAADFRPSAALFLSFAGIDYDDDPEAGAKLDAFVRWVQGVVTSFGGNLIQLTVGDKGAYLYASFGAPVAHDDDAARAVSAAVALRAPPQPYLRGVRIGVTHGQMYAGAYGSAERRTFGVLGPKTNLAARLMGRASEGGVLCDGEVVRLARRRWRFNPLEPVRVKGVEAPVAVFAPEAPLEADGERRGPLLGREAERTGLREALERLLAGEAGACLVEGDVGIGKSRLVAWLAREAAARGVPALAGSPHVLGAGVPYGAWRRIVWGLLDLEDASAAERRAAVPARVASLAPDLAHWSPLLADVTGEEGPESDLTRALAPELRQRNLAHLITELLRRQAARRPLLLILDEAHRLDSLSWELVVAAWRAVREAGVPLLLVAAYRPAELSAPGTSALGELRSRPGARTLTLGELAPAELAALAAARLGVAELPPVLATLVVERASGNPFYAEELVQTLLDDGSIRVEHAGARAAVAVARRLRDDATVLPRTLQGLILSRVDRSPAEEQLALKVAAVLGRRFRLVPLRAALATAGAVREEALRERLAALAARALVVAEASPADAYAFPHVMVHEVAYGALLYAQRQRLHRAVAEWYEARAELPPRERHPLLAHHYARAAEGGGDEALARKAIGFLELTAQADDRLGAFPEAAAGYERALGLLAEGAASDERRAGLLVQLAAVHEKMGDYRAARERGERAEALARDDRTRAAALAGLCLVHTRSGDHDAARAAGGHALALARSAGEATLTALVRGRLGIVAALDGDFPAAEEHFASAQRHYGEAGEPQNAAAWLNNLGLVLILGERYDEARPRLDEALALAREAHAKDVEAQVLMNLGLVAQRRGELDEAEARYRESLELCRTLLARQDAVTNVVNLGDIALARGAPGEAWRAYLDAAREASALGALPKALDALRGAAEVLLARDEERRAAELLGTVLRHPAANVEVDAEAARVRARLQERLDEADLARLLDVGAARSLEEALEALGA